jgi:hypothetical protein
MEKTWKPKVAGILNIVSGAFALIWFIMLLIGMAVTSGHLGIPGLEAIPSFVPFILLIIAIPSVIIGILALIGGIYALQRKKWGFALAGSIATTIFWFFVGIPAIVFLSQAKDEFE